jgi:hypothetical protein
VAVAFRTAPLPGVGRAVLHLPWPTDFQLICITLQ